ncbi:tetratricopeptide repeat protein [Sphingomonas montana]|uniref:tetratricopeptide repeat protein n=1 Tax=Sphingomonas montana TaxID=1843236 RepID=UPI00096C57C1|nr:tetratricopeptide repeat protein [Sphingomonas montana]
MTATTVAPLDTLSPDALAAELYGSPERRVALVRRAALAGVAEAQMVLGQLLLDGRDLPRDAAAAFGWFTVAARADHLPAVNMVGRCYDLGWGVAVDKGMAARWYRTAAQRGLDWGMYNYGTLLALGHGVPQDRAAGLAWFGRAADMGNAKAANFVGSFHEDGWVVPVDLAEAARCYAVAAEGGDFRGAFNHARMMIAAGDLDAAYPWLERSAAGGNARFRAQAAAWLRAHGDPACAGWGRLFDLAA